MGCGMFKHLPRHKYFVLVLYGVKWASTSKYSTSLYVKQEPKIINKR